MYRKFSIRGVMCGALIVLAATTTQAQSLDEALTGLKSYKFGDSRLALGVVEEAAINARHDKAVTMKLEKAFVALLASDAGVDVKRFVCRQLASMGTSASVDSLTGLIADPEMADHAIWALVAIPDSAALKALLDAANNGAPSQRVNVLHGIARRGSEDAVTGLVSLTDSPDKAIAQAAIAALGSIGGTGCTAILEAIQASEGKADAVLADACIQCGEWMPDSRRNDALTIYNGLYNGDNPGHIRAAALSGLVR